MIRIFRKGETDLLISGHAGSSLYGHDLICAGVSVLALTLEVNVQALGKAGKLERSLVRLEPGNTRIRCTPEEGFRAQAVELFDTVCRGFRLLAGKYPDYVSYL